MPYLFQGNVSFAFRWDFQSQFWSISLSLFLTLCVFLFLSLCVCVCVPFCWYRFVLMFVWYNCLCHLMRHSGNLMLITGDIFSPNCYWTGNLFSIQFSIFSTNSPEIITKNTLHRMCHIVDLFAKDKHGKYIYHLSLYYFCTIAKKKLSCYTKRFMLHKMFQHV